LPFRLRLVGLKRLLQLGVVGLAHHAGQRLQDLLFGIVNVLEGGNEEVFHRFY